MTEQMKVKSNTSKPMVKDEPKTIMLQYTLDSGELVERTLTGETVGHRIEEDKNLYTIWANQGSRKETFIIFKQPVAMHICG